MRRLAWIVAVTCVLVLARLAVSQTNGPVQYVYDQLGRLTAVIDANGNAAAYNYDAVDNILSISRFSSAQVSVLSFTPGQGPQGAPVTIYGTGFSATPAQNAVQFNGAAAVVTSSTSTQLVTSVPSGATSGPITVTTPQGAATSAESFVVTASSGVPTITGIAPAIALAGSAVTINGTNFGLTNQNNHVRVNSVASAVVSSSTSTTATITVPSGAGSGKITLATPSGTAVSPIDFFIPFNSNSVASVGYTGRITIGATQNVTLAAGQIAILLFDGTAGEHVNVLLNGSTFTSLTLYLFQPNGASLNSGSSIPNTVLPLDGTYAIGIQAQSAGSAGVQLFSDVSGVITIDGPPVTTTTTIPGQDVRLTFSAVAGRQVVLTVTNVSNPGATISLLPGTYVQPGSTLGIGNNPSGKVFFLDQQTLLVTGIYTIWIQHSGTSVGSETLQLNSAQDFVAPISPGGPAVRVPNSGDTIIGQNGRLTFTGLAGHRVSINVSNGTYSACSVTLQDPNLTALQSGQCGSGANPFIDSVTLNTTGTYTVFVDPQVMATGHTTIQLNDASDVTGTIAIDGAPVSVATTVQGQDARLTFTATAGQRIVAYATNVTNPQAYLYLVKPDGTVQASLYINNSPSGQTFFLNTQSLATSGTYQLWVQHRNANVGSETLQIASVPPDVTTTLTVPTAGATGLISTLTITKPGQAGTFTFGATAGQQLSFNVTSSSLSANCTIKNPDGSSLTAFSCGTSGYVGPQTLGQNGTYNIAVAPVGTATGSISMSINNDADVTGTITIDGSAVTTTTTVAGQDARLSFTATAGQRIVVYATSVTNPLAYVYLLKPGGTVQTDFYTTNSPAGQTFFLDTQTLATSGTYQLWVQHYSTNVGSETLQIASVPADFTATLTVGGATVRVPTTGNTAVGQNASLTFTGTAGQQVTINVTGPTFGTTLSSCLLTVKSPSNATLTSGYCGTGAPATLGPFTTSSAGTYTIVIDPQGSATGSVTIGLVTP